MLASSIEHFRRNVYRPRLCLVLLVLLLSPRNAHLASRSADWEVSVVDGLVVAAPATSTAVLPPSTPARKATIDDSASITACSTAPLTAPTPASASKPAQSAQPAPGSIFHLPKPSWGLLLDPNVLPTALILHALWAIRFAGMAVEDAIVKTSLIGAKSRLHSVVLPLMQIGVLALLAACVGSPWSLNGLTRRCLAWSTDAEEGQTLLPLKAIVALEALTVLVSLISVVIKMDDEKLAIWPKTVRLPSPSHSPSIIELLPLPQGIVSALTGERHRIRRRDVAQSRPGPPTTVEQEQQQTFRTVGGGDAGVMHSTSVARPLAPLRLANNDPVARRRSKALRVRGQQVQVSTRWFADSLVSLFDRAVGSVLYAIVTLHLPTLSPTSLPPVLSLLSLRSELSSLTSTWSRARGSVECLEFVHRRWGIDLSPDSGLYSQSYKWTSHDDVYCSICFELTRPKQRPNDKTFSFCRLDCGHEMHDTCLVSWLTAQAFCPTCHAVLSFSPPPPPSSHVPSQS